MREKKIDKAVGHFVEKIIEEDLASGRHAQIVTRFPPEPNGYLHIGHAKSIWLNFSMAQKYQGRCHLRFDDTNPEKEEGIFAQGIVEDVSWLGYEWEPPIRHASDYFEQLYDYAVLLIRAGKAYVCELSSEEMVAYRGTLTEAGRESPWRDRPIHENLLCFESMKNGELAEGSCVLRAKIDMASGNMNLRDPVMYRIRYVEHHRTGKQWCIYPMYDFTHCISDALEGITHSLCTLEFQDHRPLYDWYLNQLPVPCHPQQIEFARLNVSHTLTSKRKLRQLVEEGIVNGWDDPRMPTLRGMRRRGYSPRAIRHFCEQMGLSKSDSVIDMSVLESAVREDWNEHAKRAMGVLNPVKVVITNYPEDQVETLKAACHPQNPSLGERTLFFCRELYIEQGDFKETADSQFKRLILGGEVRLRNAYVICCDEAIKNIAGEIIELRCHYDPDTLGKNPEGRKVKGVIHWVSARHALSATIRLYGRLFTEANPARLDDILQAIHSDSLQVLVNCQVELSLREGQVGQVFQFERQGYFVVDEDSEPNHLLFNRVVELRENVVGGSCS